MLPKLSFSFFTGKSGRKAQSFVLMAAMMLTSVLGVPGLAAASTGAAFSDEETAKSDKNSSAKEGGNKSDKAETKADSKTSPAEMAKIVEALEERVRQLEEKLAKANPSSPAAAVAMPLKPTEIEAAAKAGTVTAVQDDAKKEEMKKNDGVLKFFRDMEVSGIVDGYYSYNNNKVDMFTQGRAFDVRHNAFSLQLA
nr:hypothetical protein [Acidobacteriota bacterium]